MNFDFQMWTGACTFLQLFYFSDSAQEDHKAREETKGRNPDAAKLHVRVSSGMVWAGNT